MPGPTAEEREAARNRELEDARWVLGSAQGRRFLGRLVFHQAGVFRTSFNTNGMAMAQNEGRRALGLVVLDLLQAAEHDALQRLMQEHLDG